MKDLPCNHPLPTLYRNLSWGGSTTNKGCSNQGLLEKGGRGMVRPWPPCQGLVESVALWDQLFQYSWKVVLKNGVILFFSTLKICAKHMKECPKVFARLLFVDLAYYQGKKGYCVKIHYRV